MVPPFAAKEPEGRGESRNIVPSPGVTPRNFRRTIHHSKAFDPWSLIL